ncbi:protein kinase apk1a chloroplastic [Phtheirospermum japonicum]|uniref:Protein kinase apk1a chloroplastic n=1 Tax=Phtheirospermum japonicum TaxID=374723 RepID=A0A830B0V3_9LAMI|nr:protein kinase apk1a chloroplastic [Phtheirospermum japonicum]
MLIGRRLLDKNRPHREHNLIEWALPYLASKCKVLRVMDALIEGQYSPSGTLKAATVSCTIKLICLT